MEARLVVEAGCPDSGTTYRLIGGRIVTLGRIAGNDIVLNDPGVSKQHLQLESRSEGWWLCYGIASGRP